MKKTVILFLLALILLSGCKAKPQKSMTCFLDTFGMAQFEFYGESPIQTIKFEVIEKAFTYGIDENNFEANKQSLTDALSNQFPGSNFDIYLETGELHLLYSGAVTEIDFSSMSDEFNSLLVSPNSNWDDLETWFAEKRGVDCERNDDTLICVLDYPDAINKYTYIGEMPITSIVFDVTYPAYIYGINGSNFDEKKQALIDYLVKENNISNIDVAIDGYVLHIVLKANTSDISLSPLNESGKAYETVTYSEIITNYTERNGYCEIQE
ncbi:MAG: hypothetical protein LBR25_04850 [Erysipelotrichaceae bacterium]|jgi:hypothetical protein|nr:hypothetical protein [Erysipelotrichaceae bacterium]